MRIIFFGSPREAVGALEALIVDGHDIVAVYTQPDRRAGRGRASTPTPVKEFAAENGLPVFTPQSLRGHREERDRMVDAAADVFVVVAYGRILPQDVLAIPPMGVVSVHPSLLPLYRGPSPVTTAIAEGATQTGVSVMLLDAGMDTGPVLAQSRPIALDGTERGAELQGRLFKEGANMLSGVLTGIRDGSITPTPQDDSKATVTRLLERVDGQIDWTMTAEEIERRVRAYDPWPGTFTSWKGKGLKILEAEVSTEPGSSTTTSHGRVAVHDGAIFVGTRSGLLQVNRLQLEGRQAVSAAEFLRGQPEFDGAVLKS